MLNFAFNQIAKTFAVRFFKHLSKVGELLLFAALAYLCLVTLRWEMDELCHLFKYIFLYYLYCLHILIKVRIVGMDIDIEVLLQLLDLGLTNRHKPRIKIVRQILEQVLYVIGKYSSLIDLLLYW